MKGIYGVLLLVCCFLLLCSEVRNRVLADDSNQKVDTDGTRHNALMPNWVPQPSDMVHVEEQRLLAAVKTAQTALIAAPKDATA